MATMQQPGTSSVTHPCPLDPRVYEEFQPNSEKKEEQDAHVLLIQLPGFRKQHLRVIYRSKGRIVVTGERPIDKTRWSRFQQEFPVPQICDPNKIRSRFERGVLTITMPNKVLTRVPPEVQEAPTPTTSTSSSEAEEQEVVPPKCTLTTASPLPIPPQKPPLSKSGDEARSAHDTGKQVDRKAVKELKKEAEKAYDGESCPSTKAEELLEKALVDEQETKDETEDSTLPGLASFLENGMAMRDEVTDEDKRKNQEDLSDSMEKTNVDMPASTTEAARRLAKRLNCWRRAMMEVHSYNKETSE